VTLLGTPLAATSVTAHTAIARATIRLRAPRFGGQVAVNLIVCSSQCPLSGGDVMVVTVAFSPGQLSSIVVGRSVKTGRVKLALH
jgi:hypothetical protein